MRISGIIRAAMHSGLPERLALRLLLQENDKYIFLLFSNVFCLYSKLYSIPRNDQFETLEVSLMKLGNTMCMSLAF